MAFWLNIALQAARSRVEKATEVAHARQKVTFNPDAADGPPKPKAKPKRRVSLGLVVNAETGEVLAGGGTEGLGGKRQSQRKHTVMNTSATVKRMKRSEEKKVCCESSHESVHRMHQVLIYSIAGDSSPSTIQT